MNSHNRMNLFQRTIAVLSATGTAALMALPVLAQAVPTEGVVNNGDVNRNSGTMNNNSSGTMNNNSGTMNNQTPSNTSDNCAPSTSGAAGGPVDSQSTSQSATTTRTSPSSYDTARTGVPNTPSSATMGQSSNQNTIGSTTYNNSTYNNNSGMQSAVPSRQFDANNRSAALPFRDNAFGTSGHEVKMNLDARQEGQNSYPTAYNSGSNQASTPLPVACAPR